MKARFWHRDAGSGITCDLCPHGCRIRGGREGLCRVRGVRNDELQALGYGHVSSAHLDPIEKKPLYHFLPGSAIFSVGGWGCNFRCAFCQNWSISQQFEHQKDVYSAQDIVATAARSESVGIAYTYNEPLVGFEFVIDCARIARERGLRNVLVTNGYIRPEPAAELLPLIDALNIDIKSMDEEFYHKQCGATLQPVLDFCRQSREAGCHVEITNLLIPGLNDADSAVQRLAEWMASNLGKTTPLHLSAYFPRHKLNVPATPQATVERAWEICRRHLAYAYTGNITAAKGQDTLCPGCQATLVQRRGYQTEVLGIRNGTCAACGRPADMVLDQSPGSD